MKVTLVTMVIALSYMIVGLLPTEENLFQDRHKSLDEAEAQIGIYAVRESLLLDEIEDDDIQVRILHVYLGQSSDLSPRFRLYLTFFHGGEVNNTKTAFDLGKYLNVRNVERQSFGRYIVQGTRLDPKTSNLEDVTLAINATQVFKDDSELDAREFSDPYFESYIEIIEQER